MVATSFGITNSATSHSPTGPPNAVDNASRNAASLSSSAGSGVASSTGTCTWSIGNCTAGGVTGTGADVGAVSGVAVVGDSGMARRG